MRRKPDSDWTEEKVARLKKMWADGLSAGQISRMIDGVVSRSAVLGKVHRLKLPARKTVILPKNHQPRRRRTKPPSVPLQALPLLTALACEPLPQQDPTDVARVSFDAYERRLHCMWPVGDPRDSGFGFCGLPPFVGARYCAHHCRVAYVPPAVRRVARVDPSPETDSKKTPAMAEV